MELIFLNRSNLRIKDHAFVSDDFQLIMDSVVYQKSYFVVNKLGVNAEVGDIAFLRDTLYFYIGIIETIEVEDDFQTKIQTNDFTSILDLKVIVSTYSGDLCLYLMNLITRALISNDDHLQNLSYLSVTKSASITGSLVYDGNTLLSITELSETLAKSYGIRCSYNLVLEDGEIVGINIDIKAVIRGMIIKSNLSYITDLIITDSQNQVVNKVEYYPKDDNVSYKEKVSYYLQTNGVVTNNKNSALRYPYVKSQVAFYSDNEYSSLLTKAQSELLKSNLEHSIEFKVNTDNSIIVPFISLNIGDFVEFVTPTKTYSTMVTQLSLKGNFYECYIVLGEYRVKLTDKIKLLEKK